MAICIWCFGGEMACQSAVMRAVIWRDICRGGLCCRGRCNERESCKQS